MPLSATPRWALVRAARSTWTTFRAAAAETPRRVWAVWLGTLALGLGLAVLVAFAVVWVGRGLMGRGMQGWDERLLDRVIAGPLSFDAGIWWESLGSSAVLIPLVLAATVMAARARRPLLALSFPLAYVGIKLLVFAAWAVWDRPRPEVVQGGIAAPGLDSYPSGHAVNTTVIYGLLAFLWARRSGNWLERALIVALLLALAGIVGWARLRLGAHWPSDVAAGAVVGAAWLAALTAALYRAGRAADREVNRTQEQSP